VLRNCVVDLAFKYHFEVTSYILFHESTPKCVLLIISETIIGKNLLYLHEVRFRLRGSHLGLFTFSQHYCRLYAYFLDFAGEVQWCRNAEMGTGKTLRSICGVKNLGKSHPGYMGRRSGESP